MLGKSRSAPTTCSHPAPVAPAATRPTAPSRSKDTGTDQHPTNHNHGGPATAIRKPNRRRNGRLTRKLIPGAMFL